MSKPTFEFLANNATPDDESGVAVWRYTEACLGEKFEAVVRQSFPSFEAAMGINEMLAATWKDGEAEGYAACERKVLAALRG
jgi:hypothetical protein